MAEEKEHKLTAKQKMFVDEYLVDMNATQACIRAGYSAKNADKIGPELLGKTWVKEAVDKAILERSQTLQVNREYVLKVITDTIERCSQARPVTDKNGDPILVETPNGQIVPAYQFQASSVLKGAELLMKHLGMTIERHDHTINGQPFQSGVLVVPSSMSAEQWERNAVRVEKEVKEE